MNPPRLPRSRASAWKKVGERTRERQTAKRYRETGELPPFSQAEDESKFDAAWKKRKRKREDAWTTYKRIGQIISDGRTTGGDIEATAERLGKWHKSIKPKAKPGEPGYMRKRNVPPTDPKHPGSKYDPTKHEAPEKGKPLRYMKPQHKDYATSFVNDVISKIAMKHAERDTPIPGNLQQRHRKVGARFRSNLKRGEDVLDKHGAKNPPLRVRMAKWIAGNNPRSEENPEGYVRSDNRRKAAVDEVSPPGWGHTKTGGKKSIKVGGTAAAMKKAKAQGRMPGVKNIFSLMWAMKNRGDKPHYKPKKKGVLKKKYRKKS